jgi:hypothetical protein
VAGVPAIMRSCLLAVLAVAVASTSCTTSEPGPRPERPTPTDPTSASTCAAETLAALEAKDTRRLAELAHPSLGVRFTPFAFPDQKTDVVLRAGELRNAFSDPTVRTWGMLGESDEPIRMTFGQYFARFVHEARFASYRPAPAGTVDPFEAASFNVDALHERIRETYPRASVFEYRHPPADPNDGHEYRVLRLVCEEHRGSHHLVGIIHSEWTP